MALTSVIIQSPSYPSVCAIQPGADTRVPDTMSVRRMDLLALALALSAGQWGYGRILHAREDQSQREYTAPCAS